MRSNRYKKFKTEAAALAHAAVLRSLEREWNPPREIVLRERGKPPQMATIRNYLVVSDGATTWAIKILYSTGKCKMCWY